MKRLDGSDGPRYLARRLLSGDPKKPFDLDEELCAGQNELFRAVQLEDSLVAFLEKAEEADVDLGGMVTFQLDLYIRD